MKYADRRALRSEIIRAFREAVRTVGPLWTSDPVRDADWEAARADYRRWLKKWATKFKQDTPKGGSK